MLKLKFINHASYIVETSNAILLHDPWLEGNAFNNGWSLLSKEISNQNLISYLLSSKKYINIWISHEHSDHFSISFIKSLKAKEINCKFFYHQTTDKRVIKYLRENNFKVIECKDGKEYRIDKEFYLYVYYYKEGDSFCFLKTNKKNILNINDCVIEDEKQARRVLSCLPKNTNTDILLTQFGYASWIGRPEDIELRKKSADEKFSRISLIENVFKPEVIIPFASFIYFCKQDNFYLNDQQNFPKNLRESLTLKNIQNKINFMKPNQEIKIDDNVLNTLQIKTKDAEEYWNSYKYKINDDHKIKYTIEDTVKEQDLINIGNKYISNVRYHTLGMVCVLEFFKLLDLKPIFINVYDLKINLCFSYLKGIRIKKTDKTNMSIHSSELAFILKNEFGWNTLHVSGAFRSPNNEVKLINNFFRWQDLIKNGFSFKNPFYIFKASALYMFRKIISI